MPAHPKPSAKPKKPRGFGAANKARVAAEPKVEKPERRKTIARIKVHGEPSPKAVSHQVIDLPKGQTKGALILAMLKTPSGATSKEIEAATGWQPHSVRGYLGTLRKSGVVVISKKLPKEPTIYRVAAEKASDEVL